MKPTCSPIAAVEVIPVVVREARPGELDGTQDTVVVRLTDEHGRTGIGEADAPPNVVRAFLEMPTAHLWSQNPAALLVGADPFERAALFDRLYEATLYPGRRGLGIHALSAVDVALHDLVGKQLGRPVWQLLGGARREALDPYATVYPGLPHGRSLAELMADIGTRFEQALSAGFRAVKMEVLFEDLATDRELVGAIREGRRMLGDEIALALDFGYRWRDWRAALDVLQRVADCDILFAEATLHHDDLAAHARLAERSPIRIGGAEFAATRFECREWLERARVDVLQPDLGRCGGFTELGRIAALAADHGAQVVPHGWKTGITAAAGCHFQAATANAPTFEFLSPALWDSTLRSSLVGPEPEVVDGRIALPPGPGLGVELDDDVLERYRADR